MGTVQLLLVLVAVAAHSSQAQWLVYPESTEAGNSPGRACIFPFIYNGQTYNECTTIDNGFVPWCSTTANYDNNGQWGRCMMALPANRTRAGNAGKSTCSLPFIYKGQTYENCTAVDWRSNKPWCATSPNYARDKRWAECVRYPDMKTTGGNVPAGSKCNFPFWYRNQQIHGCITTNNQGIPWCSVTPSWEGGRLWGNCRVTTLPDGNSNCPEGNTYSRANNTLTFGGTDVSGPNTAEECKAECDKNNNCVGFDYDSNPGVNPRCFLHVDAENFNQKEKSSVTRVDQYTLVKRCADGPGSTEPETGKPVTTRGGNGGPTNRCVFPFSYQGNTYGSCTSQRWFTPWCAVTSNYGRDTRWGECVNIPTV